MTALAVLNLQSQSQKPAVGAALAKAVDLAAGHAGGRRLLRRRRRRRRPPTPTAPAWPAGRSASPAGSPRRRAGGDVLRELPARQAGQCRPARQPRSARSPTTPPPGPQAQTSGITDATSDQWRRATAQAAPGLPWDPAAPAHGDGRHAAQRVRQAAGRRARSRSPARQPGERVCVTDSAGRRRGADRGTGGHADLRRSPRPRSRARTSPSRPTTRARSATDERRRCSARTRLKPKAAKTVHQGGKVIGASSPGSAPRRRSRSSSTARWSRRARPPRRASSRAGSWPGSRSARHKLKVGRCSSRTARATTFRVVR